MSIQQQGAFTLTARTFPGDLAELERIMAELEIDAPHVVPSYLPPSLLSYLVLDCQRGACGTGTCGHIRGQTLAAWD